jgi:hypothetical protein
VNGSIPSVTPHYCPNDVADRFKNDVRMLPQFGPPEGETADKPGIGKKRVLLKRRSATFPRGDRPQGQRNEARKGLFGVQKLAVFVLDKRKKPPMPCSEKRARLLLTRGRAVVHRRYPFTTRAAVIPLPLAFISIDGICQPTSVPTSPTQAASSAWVFGIANLERLNLVRPPDEASIGNPGALRAPYKHA